MKINITQTPPARVVFPVRLIVRAGDLQAYQAATLSHRAYVDATIDLGPEDFTNDQVRLAARDLASLLSLESDLSHDHFLRNRTTGSVIPGSLSIEVAYPFDEAEVRQSVINLVGDALRQQDFVTSAYTAFETWAGQVESTLRLTATALLNKHKNALSKFGSLQVRRKEAIEQLDTKALLGVLNDYRKLAQTFPSEEEVQSDLASAISLTGLPSETRLLPVKLHLSPLWASHYMDDLSESTRTTDPQPSIEVSIAITCASDVIASRRTTLDLSIVSAGSLLMRTENKRSAVFTDLDPLLGAINQIHVDWGRFDRTISKSKVPDDIQAALNRVASKDIAEEAEAWIRANGSPSLKLGLEHDFSMTRQYRLERAQTVLADFLSPYAGWSLVLAGDIEEGVGHALKASPSARALNVLVGVKTIASDATILYSAELNEETAPDNGEYVWLPEEQCFPHAPGIAICWPLPATTKNTRKKRR